MRPVAVFVTAMISLSGCAKVGSDGSPLACPPLVEYSRAEQTQVADEVEAARERAYRWLVGRLCRCQGAGEGVWVMKS